MHREGFSQLKNRYRREAIAHARIFPQQRGPSKLDAVRIASANVMSDYVHATLRGKLLQNLFDIPRFRAARFHRQLPGVGAAPCRGGNAPAPLLLPDRDVGRGWGFR